MRFSSLLTVLALAGGVAFSAGCRPPKPPKEHAAILLNNPDPEQRESAAKELAGDDGPPVDMLPALMTAAEREKDAKVFCAILITLARSGAPEARPYLEVNLDNRSKEVAKAAKKGLEIWSKKNLNGVPPPAIPVVPAGLGAPLPPQPLPPPPPPPGGLQPLPPPPPEGPQPLPPPPPPPAPPPAVQGQQI